MIKLVIFDLDGTLADTIGDLAAAANGALAAHGYPVHDIDAYRYFVGNGISKLIERALPSGVSEQSRDEVFKDFTARYEHDCMRLTKAYDHMPELVSQLKQAGIRCAVASNKPDVFSKLIVEELYGEDKFDIICGKKDGCPAKPDPAVVFDILGKLGVSAKEALFVGDSNVDVHTAHNAGIKCIGCEWGFRGADELREAGADIIVSDPSDIFSAVQTF